MSHTSAEVQLVLFDAAALQLAGAHPAVVLARTRDVKVGAISNRPDVEQLVEAAGHADLFDVWVAGRDGDWPFARAVALIDGDPGRTLFVSEDPAALREAEDAGMRTLSGGFDELERALT